VDGKISMWETATLMVAGKSARVRVTGSGAPLVLLHGGWAGAEAHWGPVADRFAARHRVIAPELPGIMEGESLSSYAEYARWVLALLDALDVREPVVCVGNSLGAAITTSLAAVAPERLAGIVLVNGGARADRIPAVRILRSLPGGLRVLRWMVRHDTYSPATIGRAFADARRAPQEVVATVSNPSPPQVDVVLSLFLAGEPDMTRRLPTLVVWGREDRLIGMSMSLAERTARERHAEKLVVVEHAGHLPQVEQPEAFVDAVEAFVAGVHGHSRGGDESD
jgi:pimeloyl-ACP methyl ester carboxylesterase